MIIRSFKISYSRKDGRSNYGSEGASVELSVDLSEEEDPIPAMAEASAIARRCVDDQLSGPVPVETPVPAPSTQPAPAHPRESDSRITNPPLNNGQNGLPHSGRQLYSWAKKQEEAGNRNLIRWLRDWGQANGCPDKFVDWPQSLVEQAVAEHRGAIAAN